MYKGVVTLSSLSANLSGNVEDVLDIYVKRKSGFITKVLSSGQQPLSSKFLIYYHALSWILFF